MDDSVDDRLKEVVPRDAIVREIEAVREKLVEMRKHPKSSSEREAIFRQLYTTPCPDDYALSSFSPSYFLLVWQPHGIRELLHSLQGLCRSASL